jgi:hypothetical protein
MCLLANFDPTCESGANRLGLGRTPQERFCILPRTAYWIFTILLVAWLLAGGAFDLMHAPGAIEILRKLGYPEYLGSILGVCKLLAIPALLYPKAPTLREWAYAGIVFDGLGAFFSHIAVRDGGGATVAPLIFLAFAAISYVLRPARSRAAQFVPAQG